MADTFYDSYGNQVEQGAAGAWNASAFDRGQGAPNDGFRPGPDYINRNQQAPVPSIPANEGLNTPTASMNMPSFGGTSLPNPYTYSPQTHATGNPNQTQAPGTTPTYGNGQPGAPVSPYGANPFLPNPTVAQPNGTNQAQNPMWWASQSTADQVAKMLGGTVQATNPFGGNFSANQPQYMIQLPDGRMVNPGSDVADLYNHGYSQNFIDEALTRLKNNDFTPAGPNNRPQLQLDPSVAPYFKQGDAGQVSVTPLGQNPTGGTTGNTGANPLQSFLSQLQQMLAPKQQTDPFAGLIAQLYGSNPINTALGQNSSLSNSLLSSGQSTSSIAQLLNVLFSLRNNPSSGILSPLFWGSQAGSGGNSQSNYFPTFP